MIALAQRKAQLIGQAEDSFAARCGLAVPDEAQMPRRDPRLEGEFELAQVLKTAGGDALGPEGPDKGPCVGTLARRSATGISTRPAISTFWWMPSHLARNTIQANPI